MTSAKPKTKPKPVDRQSYNQREYERLLAEVKSHLEHRSPGIWDWVTDTYDKAKDAVTDVVRKVSDWAGDTSKKIDDATGGAWETASAPIIDAGYKAGEAIDKGIDAVTEWGSRETVKAGDAYDKGRAEAKDLADEAVGETEKHLNRGGDTVNKTIKNSTYKAGDVINKVTEVVNYYTTEVTEKVGDIINKVNITLGVGIEAAWAALGGLPDLLNTFKTDLTNWFTFDAAEFNEAMAKLSEAMKPAEMPEPPTEVEG